MYIETPYYQSEPLSERVGKNIYLKFESSQPSGSFKLRGMTRVCEDAKSRGCTKLVSSSGGNAGIAAAYCAKHLGMNIDVVVPETTSQLAITQLNTLGASVTIHGESWVEANDYAQSLVDDSTAFIHPFDDPLLWDGHATMIDEMAKSNAPIPDMIILSVGGGGLLSGVVEGLIRNQWNDVKVLAVETHGANSFNASLKAGKLLSLDAITSTATSLGAKKICETAFNAQHKVPLSATEVSDESAITACRQFLDDHRVLVEPACGASLSIAYDQSDIIMSEDIKTIAIIVCGGSVYSLNGL